jgi:LPPG:FO 2-phospho-L-lactate transferase
VRDKAQVDVREVSYAGAEAALPAPGVVEAIHAASHVIVCPSNPITSIGPILAVSGIAHALAATGAATAAISPIVGHDAVSGPAGRLMAAAGLPVSAAGVGLAYASWLDVLLFDERDSEQATEIKQLGIRPVTAQTIMARREDEVALARRTLEALREMKSAVP